MLRVGGDVVGLPFIGIVLHRFSTEDAQAAQEIDAELDRAEQSSVDDPGEDAPAGKLWWEDDPQIADRFRRG